MIKLLLALALGLLNLFIQAQSTIVNSENTSFDITVKVQNISSNKGKVILGLYNSEENFNKKMAFSGKIGTINDFKSEVVFTNVPKGTYAIICFHDENENNQMDFEGFMPTEDYGATNNPNIFGPPQFNVSKFEVKDANLTFEIFF
jgi:uncharacterized protein (DUF2141 family)